MKLFSQRKDLKPVKSIIQVDSMDDDLRNGLWAVLTFVYWNSMDKSFISLHHNTNVLCVNLWVNYFKKPIDSLRDDWDYTHGKIRRYFFGCGWNEVYDFIEFVSNSHPDKSSNRRFMKLSNKVLERELSGYRFVGGKIEPITSEEEIAEVEEALRVPEPLKPVSDHLKKALALLADRKSAHYAGSIKESISAVEAMCQLITGEKSATLGRCLKAIKDKVSLHPALEKAFKNLYGYTSEAEGIRHALLEESSLDLEDAKFMLVSCSAFVNYLIAKSAKAGIKF